MITNYDTISAADFVTEFHNARASADLAAKGVDLWYEVTDGDEDYEGEDWTRDDDWAYIYGPYNREGRILQDLIQVYTITGDLSLVRNLLPEIRELAKPERLGHYYLYATLLNELAHMGIQ